MVSLHLLSVDDDRLGYTGTTAAAEVSIRDWGSRTRRHGRARACQCEPSEQRVDERRVSQRIFPLLLTVERPPRFLTVPPPLCGSHEVQVIVVVDELYTFLFHGGFHPWIGEGLELDLPLAIVWRLEPVDDVSRVASDLAEF